MYSKGTCYLCIKVNHLFKKMISHNIMKLFKNSYQKKSLGIKEMDFYVFSQVKALKHLKYTR